MRILVIEDNKEIRELLKLGLETEMFSVDTVEDGESGSYIARTNDYDLILLDNILPKKTGSEVCQEIRKAGKNTPVILMSVKSDTDEKVRLLTVGADDYVTKPFSFKELLARIHAILRRPETNLPENLATGDLVLNSRTHEVRRGNASIYLTRKEYSLLELLIRHSGEVVSRGAIMEHVWDLDGNPFSNTIETHVFNLRRKLEKGKDRLIWNVPGRGYKIAASPT
ncbi:MAG: response regulator transcription factor [Patescibacteria group bacterium]